MKIIVYIAVSQDGFIADAQGGVSWLDPFNDCDYGYKNFYDAIGIVVMGRTTYDQVLTFGEWPYAGKHSYVLTHHPIPSLREDVSLLNQNVSDFLTCLKKAHKGKRVWLMGGAAIIDAFQKAHAIREIYLFQMPVALHHGIALSPDILSITRDASTNMTLYPNGVIEYHKDLADTEY